MRRRLLIILVPLAFVLVTALGLPLGTAVAQRETQETYVDRLNDAGRFASLAETALSTGRTEALAQELDRYHELYGISAALLATHGAVLLGPADTIDAARQQNPAMDSVISAALAGYRPEPATAQWPWDDSPLIVAEPVGRDSEVAGVIVIVSATDEMRSAILSTWGRLALIGLVPLIGLVAVAWPVSHWMVRPVRKLDDTTDAIAQGDLTIRADTVGGPPELRRLAGSFNTMMDTVEQALRRQRAFVSDASHQLRNPLASLRLAVENLAPYLSDPQAREVHETAVDEAASMHRMLNSLLAAARMESVKSAEPVDVDTLLATRIDRWEALAASRGVSVELDVTPGLCVLEPPGGLGGILDELVSNALRLSGGTRVRIAATTRPAGDGGDGNGTGDAGRSGPGELVELVVADDGTGLTPEELDRATHRFWRSSRHQNVAGTGLGLAICAELVESAGGRLRLEPGLAHQDGAGGAGSAGREGGGGGGRRGLAAVVELPAAPPDQS